MSWATSTGSLQQAVGNVWLWMVGVGCRVIKQVGQVRYHRTICLAVAEEIEGLRVFRGPFWVFVNEDSATFASLALSYKILQIKKLIRS